MVMKLLSKPICAVCIALAILPTTGQTRWRFPVTIEALRDVTARAAESGGQMRGVLYVSGGESFTIKKGQRFHMVKIYTEGECRIEFESKQYDVSSCPWMDGFTDHQEDVFKIVPGDSVRELPE